MNKKHRDLELSLAAFSNMKSNYHNDWIELEKLYNSEHDKEFIKTAKDLERSHLFIPIAKSTCDIIDAIFTEAFFGAGNPIEITRNEVDESSVTSCLNVLVKYYYDKSKPYIPLSMAFSSASRYGLGAVLPYWNSNTSLPVTKFIPPTKIAFDNEALTRDEIQYVSYKFKQTKQDITSKVKSKFYDKIKEKDLYRTIGRNYDRSSEIYKRIDVVEVYSLKSDGKFTCRTFIKDKLVREKVFKKNPIKYGYLTAILPTIDETLQDNQSAGVGESVLQTMKELTKEINQKRNQIVDLHEQLIDPLTHVGDDADIDAEDAGKIKGVINVGDPTKIKRYAPTNTFAVEKEVALIEKDINDVTAINGMQRGETSSSDRRGASAMAMINANSSARLSKMATTINDTLFQEWAEAFVYMIYVNAPDYLVLELFGSNPLGALGMRQELDYMVSVKFGQSINRDVKISELTMLLQMLNGREDADIMPILQEVLKLILGDAFDTKSIFTRVERDGGEQTSPASVEGEESEVVGRGESNIADRPNPSNSSIESSSGNSDSVQFSAASNQI